MPNRSKQQPSHSSANNTEKEPRKPFVPPQLRREAELTKLTAERIFTFNGGES